MNTFKQRHFKLTKNKQYDHVLYFVDLPNYKLSANRRWLSMFFNNPKNILIKITNR